MGERVDRARRDLAAMRPGPPEPKIEDVCEHCGTRHGEPLRRYRCENCRRTVCHDGAHDGRRWNRRGELVHLIIYRPERGKGDVVRICGTLSRVDDYDGTSAASGEATEAIEASAGPLASTVAPTPLEAPQEEGA
jgi:hypothetical protein